MNKKKLFIGIALAIAVAAAASFLIYTGVYYHADHSASAALMSDENVAVIKTDYGWLFDGPSKEDALVFYPGGKVEEEAYAPFSRMLAEKGMDVCLVKMPLRLAFFGINKAGDVMKQHDYRNWYVGGHSLGGAMAAIYASGNGSRLEGVVLLAAYPTKPLEKNITVMSIYGSNDGVLNQAKLSEGRKCVEGIYRECVIQGGNHAGFGSYGVQEGDGKAEITAEEQQKKTAEFIIGEKGELS
ncbi:MAG: alpha/beta hydrolase [Lachnospiraceae bacterium]|nr:alpha/beta hydrolase [Lachnospiraceae bacterium]